MTPSSFHALDALLANGHRNAHSWLRQVAGAHDPNPRLDATLSTTAAPRFSWHTAPLYRSPDRHIPIEAARFRATYALTQLADVLPLVAGHIAEAAGLEQPPILALQASWAPTQASCTARLLWPVAGAHPRLWPHADTPVLGGALEQAFAQLVRAHTNTAHVSPCTDTLSV